ncbi:transposase domain protein, partial [Neisseria meningitidis 63023]
MSTFFQQTAQAMIAKHIDRFPLLKLDQVIDWQPIEQYLNRQRIRYVRDHRGRPAYPLLSIPACCSCLCLFFSVPPCVGTNQIS